MDTLKEIRDKHSLSIKQVADLLKLTSGTVTTYCSVDSDNAGKYAVELESIINNAYDVAAEFDNPGVKEMPIKQLAKKVIMMNFRLGTEAYRVFQILGS